MTWSVPPQLESELDGIIARYPQQRSASLMVLHALQEHFGFLSKDAVEWTAAKLGLEPINILELVTFYPMFRQAQLGRFHFKICRTLSCALGGSHELHQFLCRKLALDPQGHGPQTTPDGKFTVEFVECLASCGTAPVMMVNDTFHEGVSTERAEKIVAECQ
jgi:NADH-quinone oxidoreductase subunit E